MCGIVGVIGQNKDRTKIFTEMLYADVFRGHDSTGVFGVDERQDGVHVRWDKRALPSYEFMHTIMWRQFVNDIANKDYLVGHNRKTTVGTTSDSTAHPFQVGHITLVHNGTLRGNWRNYLKAPTGTTVDSFAITHAIASMGADAVIPLLEGAFTLVWYDRELKTFNLVRNDERPLGMLKIKDSAVVFASEIDLAKWIVTRNGHKVESVWEPEEGVQHIYTSGGKEVATKKHKLFTGTSTYGATGGGAAYNTGGRYQDRTLLKHGVSQGDILYFRVDRKVRAANVKEERWTVHGTTVYRKKNFTVKAYWTNGAVMEGHPTDAIYKAKVSGIETVYENDVLVRDMEHFANTRKEFKQRVKEEHPTFQETDAGEEGAEKTTTGTVIALPPPTHHKGNTFPGPYQRRYTLDRLAPYLDRGCGCCDNPITNEDVIEGQIMWIQDSPLCPECTKDVMEEDKGVTLQ